MEIPTSHSPISTLFQTLLVTSHEHSTGRNKCGYCGTKLAHENPDPQDWHSEWPQSGLLRSHSRLNPRLVWQQCSRRPIMSQIFYHILSENKKNLSCYFSEILKFSMENRTNINKSVLLQLNVKTYFHMAKIKIDINILLTSINI